MALRTLLVDDHPIIRDTLVTTLTTLGIFDEVDTASSFQQLLDQLEKDASYQLLILDLSLTDVTGSDAMLYVREHYTDIPVVIFSGNDSTDMVAQCFEKGVQGFVSKESSMQVIVSAIRMVLAGGTYIPPAAVRSMGFEPTDGSEPIAGVVSNTETVRLSPKQREVYAQLMLGMPNKVIASRLGIAEGTVKTHLHSIYRTLRVSNRAQAILKSRALRIVD